jgi:cAMP-dependent protein kinase regulator
MSDRPSPIDRAFRARLAGEDDEALRVALAVVAANPGSIEGVLVVAEALAADPARRALAGEAAVSLARAFLARGDLPGSVVAMLIAEKCGVDPKPIRNEIAAAFSKDSDRIADVSPAPPSLPAELAADRKLEKAKTKALRERGEKALRAYLETADVLEDRKLPALPLFSALQERALARLLACFTMRDFAEGARAIEQGAEGKEAFVVVRGLFEAIRASDDGDVRLAMLGPGAIFGEMALVSEAPRAASVRAVEPARALVVSRDALERESAIEPAIASELGTFCHGRMVANLVRHSSILASVEPAERASLMSRFSTRRFETGQRLVEQGTDSEGLFLIASGKVDVVSTDAEGDPIRIADLGPGEVVGEISLVLRRPATANVTASHPTVALCLSREEFQLAIKDHPALLNELYELATRREDELRSVVAQEALDIEDVVLL